MTEGHSIKQELLEQEETRKLCERFVEFVNPGVKVPVYWRRGEGWYWNFQDNYIVMDLDDLENKSRDYCIGVALHEAMHVWMSRTEFFTDEEWRQLGFAIGFNFAEDCGIENAAERVHQFGKKIIKGHLDEDVKSGGGLDIDINKNINSALGYIPKHMILGGVMRQYFHGRQIAGTLNENGKVSAYGIDANTVIDQSKLTEFMDRIKGIDAEVEVAFTEIRPLLEKFWDTIPEMYDNEEEIKAFAEGRAKVYREIWEIYKKLVERSVEEQSLKDFIDQLIQGGEFNAIPMPGGGQAIVINFDSLPPEVQKELIQLMQDQHGQQEQPQNQAGGLAGGDGQSGNQTGSDSNESRDNQSSSGGGSGQSKPSARPSQSGTSSDIDSNNTASESTDGSSQLQPSKTGGKPTGVPWDKVSPESKEKIKEQHGKLDDPTKQELKDKAEQQLGGVEDEVNEQIGGKSDRPGVKRPTNLKEKKPEDQKDGSDGEGGSESGQGELGSGDEKAQSPSDTEKNNNEQQNGDSYAGGGDGDGDSASQKEKTEKETSQPTEKPQSTGATITEADPTFSRTSQNQEPKTKPRPEDIQGTREQQKALDRFYAQLDIGEANLPLFDQVKNDPAVREACDILKTKLEPIFKPKQKKKRRYAEDGPEVDIDRVIAHALGDTENREFMYSEERPTRMNYRFTIIVDLSSSMTSKLEEVFKMIVILAETLSYLGIEFEIQGFTDGLVSENQVLKTYKPYSDTTEFGQNLTDQSKNDIASMLNENLDGTPTSTAFYESFENLKARNQETSKDGRKIDIMMMLTDGRPTDSTDKLNSQELLQAMISQIRTEAQASQMALAILGLGIGSGTHFVNDVFPSLPLGLRNDIAMELNSFYERSGLTAKLGSKPATAEDIGNSFYDTFELTIVLPTIFEYIIKNPHEFTNPNEVQ